MTSKPLAAELAALESEAVQGGRGRRGPHWSLEPRPAGQPRRATKDALRREVLSKQINGYLVLDPKQLENGEAEYFSTTVSDFIAQVQLQDAIRGVWMRQKMEARGLPADLSADLEKRIDMKVFKLTEKGESEEKGAGILAAIIFLVLMYSTFFMYGYQVMRGVIEEKSSRIVEIIVASVRPTELMLGKILGIGLVGLTQYFVWSLVAMNLSLPWMAAIIAGGSDLGVPRIPISMLGLLHPLLHAGLLPVRQHLHDDRRAVQHGPGGAAAGDDPHDAHPRRLPDLPGRHEQPERDPSRSSSRCSRSPRRSSCSCARRFPSRRRGRSFSPSRSCSARRSSSPGSPGASTASASSCTAKSRRSPRSCAGSATRPASRLSPRRRFLRAPRRKRAGLAARAAMIPPESKRHSGGRMDSSGELQVLVDAPRTVALSEELNALAPAEAAARLAEETDERAARALSLLNPAAAADILGNLTEERRNGIIAAAPDGRGEQWRVDLQYDEDSVGRLMERPAGVFRPETTVAEAVERLRELVQRTFITYVFVTDAGGRLVGVLAFRELLFARPEQRLEEIMLRDPFSLKPDAPLVDAMRTVVTRHYPAYPVTDAEGRLVGMVRGQALFERQAYEISAQAGSMVGVEKEERVGTHWLRSFKFRHPWLQLNLLTAFVAAAVVGIFQDTIDRVVVLAAFLPVLAGQSATPGARPSR
jgi:CBS domain-containing protein